MESKQSNHSARNGRKGRWSVMDTFILLLLLAVLAGIVYRVFVTVTDEGPTGTVCQVYFDVMETHRDVLGELHGFETVYLYENDMRLGAIGAVEADGDTAADLTIQYVEGTDMATAKGRMTCRASLVEDGSILVEGTGRYLTRGSVLQIRTDRVLLTIQVTDVQVKS